MDFKLSQPPRIGAKVRQSGSPSVPQGSYTVVGNSSYDADCRVAIAAPSGERYSVAVRFLELIENSSALEAVPVPVDSDGITTLPSEEALRAFGFTGHREGYWYYTARVGSAETLNITVAKEPLAGYSDPSLGEPVYGYTELVMDEYFGQPAYFGQMKEEHRIALATKLFGVLRGLYLLGLQIEVDPQEYGWESWPEGEKLQGHIWGNSVPEELKEPFLAICSEPEPEADELTLDPELLKLVAAAIDQEAVNLQWDSVAGAMSLGEYAAPTAIRTYLQGLKAKG